MERAPLRMVTGVFALVGAATLLSCARSLPPAAATPIPASATPPIPPPIPLGPSIPDGSTMIFLGVVVSRDAATRITSVRATQTYRTPEPIGPLDGTIVRVVSDSLPLNTTALFYAAGIAAGSQLVIQELSSVRLGPDETPTIAAFVAQADFQAANASVARSAKNADAVVAGVVVSTRAIAISDSARGRLGEHSPLWREASFRVTSALRDDNRAIVGQMLNVMYDAGSDEGDRESARLEPQNSLVLLLRWSKRIAPNSRHGVDVTGRYFVFDAADALPAKDSTRVARLVQ
ncbi:MAG: hypothetical protein ABJE47_20545 [bacterium]